MTLNIFFFKVSDDMEQDLYKTNSVDQLELLEHTS